MRIHALSLIDLSKTKSSPKSIQSQNAETNDREILICQKKKPKKTLLNKIYKITKYKTWDNINTCINIWLKKS